MENLKNGGFLNVLKSIDEQNADITAIGLVTDLNEVRAFSHDPDCLMTGKLRKHVVFEGAVGWGASKSLRSTGQVAITCNQCNARLVRVGT